jgi:WD40 repeat protein
MGAVYLGQHEVTGGYAAVKVIRPEYAANAEYRARLRREVAAASRVPRFCTAPVLAADPAARIPWVATEYIDAPTLDVVQLEHGRLTGASLEAFAVGVAVALRAIHQQGIIHRDLKPSNILITPFGPRVIDFGVARLDTGQTQLTRTGAAVGTPVHMAPEQILGHPLTAAVDVFAWAGLVSYAATGRLPFGAGEAAPRAIVHDPPDLGGLPPSLRDLVAAAFHKDPAHRPSAAQLVERLSGTAADATAQVMATAAAVPHSAPAVPRPRRRRWTAVAAAALAAAAIVAVAAVAVPRWLSASDGGQDGSTPPPFGTQLGQPLGATATVTSVAVGELAGTPIAVAANAETLQVFDLATHAPIGEPLTGHTGLVQAVAVGELDGVPIAASAGIDGLAYIWDLTSRRPVGTPLATGRHVRGAVALGVLGGTPIAVTIGQGTTLQVWDLRTREPRGDPLTGHTGPITSVAVGTLDGTPVAVSASEDTTIRLWDLDTHQPVGEPLTGHTGSVNSVAVGTLAGTPIAVSASSDETVRVWDLRARRPVGEPLTGHTGTINIPAGLVNSVALGEVDGVPIAVSASSDETVRVWNLAAHQPLGEPLTGHTSFLDSVAVGQVNGVPVAVSGGHDSTVRVWSLAAPDLSG